MRRDRNVKIRFSFRVKIGGVQSGDAFFAYVAGADFEMANAA